MPKYQNRKNTTGDRIKKERKRLGLSIKDFLSKIYMSEQSHKTIAAWEKGERLPDLESLYRMADLFQCDIGYLLGDYPEKTKVISDVCTATGLSAAAVKAIVGDESDGFRNIRIEALNFLLTSPNFENALHELSLFKRAERDAATFEAAREKELSSIKDISEYHPNIQFLDLVAAKRKEANLCEYNLSKTFTFLIEELKRAVDKEVSD